MSWPALVATATTTVHTDHALRGGMHHGDDAVVNQYRQIPVPPWRVRVAERMTSPSSRREARNFTHPSFGSLIRACRRLRYSTAIFRTLGKRNDGAHRRPERHRTLQVP